MTRTKRSRFVAATALAIAGSLLGCASQIPAGPDARGEGRPVPAPAGATAPGQNASSGVGAAAGSLAGTAGPRNPAMLGGAGASPLGGNGLAATVPIPERDEPVIPADALKYRAPIHSLEDVLKMSGLGPVPESQAPDPELVKKILPRRLSQAQAASLLVKVPADMVQAAGLDELPDEPALGGGADAASPAIAGAISASSLSASSHGPGRKAGGRFSEFSREEGRSGVAGRSHGNVKGERPYSRGEGEGYRQGSSQGRDGGLGRADGLLPGDRERGSYGRKAGGRAEYERGGRTVGGDGDRIQPGELRHRSGKHRGTRWSRWGHADPELVLAESWGWNSFIFDGVFHFFPVTIFGALHFFPFTFVSGFFYPAFCPFYFSAAFFFPYCQAPLVWFGTFGLVSGCPTCPISGRPLLWLPGEVPVI